MSSNRAVKERLIERYGAECFIERLKLRDTSGLTYKSKGQYKRMKMLTYHHIREKSKGGKATIENGALLSGENHIWFHQQDRADRERMNQQFQELKRNIDNGYEPCEVVLAPEEEIELPFELDAMTIQVDSKGIKVTGKKKKNKVRRKHNRPRKRRYGRER